MQIYLQKVNSKKTLKKTNLFFAAILSDTDEKRPDPNP